MRKIINCNKNPLVPKGYRIYRHVKGEEFLWDPSKILLYFIKSQKEKNVSEYNIQQKILKQKPFNACVLDFLLKDKRFIPKKWIGLRIYFLGTIYKNYVYEDCKDRLFVRGLDLHLMVKEKDKKFEECEECKKSFIEPISYFNFSKTPIAVLKE